MESAAWIRFVHGSESNQLSERTDVSHWVYQFNPLETQGVLSILERCLHVYMLDVDSVSDDLFVALSNSYRRQLLVALLERNPQDDHDRDPLNIVSEDVESEVLEFSLYHSHLPQLEQMGFVTWDQETDEIRKGPDWNEIEPLLTLMHEHRDELPDDWL